MSRPPIQVKYSYLCKVLWDNNTNKSNKADLLVDEFVLLYSFSESEKKDLKRMISRGFLTQFNKQWKTVSRRKDYFETKYPDFLNKDFIFDFDDLDSSRLPQQEDTNEANKVSDIKNKRGRPHVSFGESSKKTKLRRAKQMASDHTHEELCMAFEIKQKEFTAKTDEAKSHDESEKKNCSEHHRNQSLAMFMDTDLSKGSYEKLRVHNQKMFGIKMYPIYREITAAKQECYPDHIKFNDLGAKVNFISLIDHTIRRIVKLTDGTVVQNLPQKKLVFLGKWGMDGASAQQTTRQSWSSEKAGADTHMNDNPSDASVFITSFVQLQLRANDEIVWVNSKPNSVLYCRPVSFKFIKETPAVIRKNYVYYSKMLDKVKNYCLNFENMDLEIKLDINCTMLDGKEHYAITNKESSASCNICDALPSQMNNITTVLERECKTEFYKLGFPVLHSWIRCMEYILHIAYNSDFQKTMAKGEDKTKKAKRKSKIQTSLQNELQLTVDIVKQGTGTTNTGNVGRDFFENAERVSELIGVDKDIIDRLYTVLQVISCGKDIDLHKFNQFCIETAKECVRQYSWYRMPPSVHKLLIHGCDIMKELKAPMVWFSEEPQEAANKIFRKARSEHSRMYQRSATNEDILHFELVSSDPIISKLRDIKERKHKDLTLRAQQFIIVK